MIKKLQLIWEWIKEKTRELLAFLGIIGVGVVISITVLTIHSHPQAGDDWAVDFETTGYSDLTIKPDDQSSIDDLDFVSLKCNGEERIPQILENDVIFYPNWFCIGTGEIVHKVNIAGNHYLEFQFGDKTSMAYNASTKYSTYTYKRFYYSLTDTAPGGITFIPDTSHTISSIKLQAYKKGTPHTTVYIRLYETSGGYPTGDVLAVGSFDGTDLTSSTSGEQIEVALSSYVLYKDTMYALIMENAGVSAANCVAWLADSSTVTGYNAVRKSSGNWAEITDRNGFWFEEWGTAYTPPVATSNFLLMF